MNYSAFQNGFSFQQLTSTNSITPAVMDVATNNEKGTSHGLHANPAPRQESMASVAVCASLEQLGHALDR